MTDIVAITMPKWGLSMHEGRVVEWLVEEGAEILEAVAAAGLGLRVHAEQVAHTGAAAMAAAGHYGRTGDEAVVEEIVGTGDPNAEFREQVFGLLVGMISRSRESEASAREREEAMEASGEVYSEDEVEEEEEE